MQRGEDVAKGSLRRLMGEGEGAHDESWPDVGSAGAGAWPHRVPKLSSDVKQGPVASVALTLTSPDGKEGYPGR